MAESYLTDRYLGELRRHLHGVDRRRRELVVEEVAGHLEDLVAEEMVRGPGGATERAIARLGAPVEIAASYRAAYGDAPLALRLAVALVLLAQFGWFAVLAIEEAALADWYRGASLHRLSDDMLGILVTLLLLVAVPAARTRRSRLIGDVLLLLVTAFNGWLTTMLVIDDETELGPLVVGWVVFAALFTTAVLALIWRRRKPAKSSRVASDA